MSQQKQILIIDELGTPKSKFEEIAKELNLDYEIVWNESEASPDKVEVIVTVLKKIGKDYLEKFR